MTMLHLLNWIIALLGEHGAKHPIWVDVGDRARIETHRFIITIVRRGH